MFAKGVSVAKVWLNTEEFQVFGGREKLPEGQKVAGSNFVIPILQSPKPQRCESYLWTVKTCDLSMFST